MPDQIGDVLEQLLEFKWRDVSFPVTDVGTDLEHDLMQHKWPDRDGAHVEATGRAPLVHTATIPFLNNLSPGLAETWNVNGQALYPTVFRAFLVAAATRSSGPLQHPELGIVTCKPHKFSFKWSSQRRDGVMCSASWIESDDTTGDFEDILARKSPVSEARVSSADLDAQIVQYANPTITADGDSSGFLDNILAITSAFDQATLLQAQYAGKIDHVLYRVNALEGRMLATADVTAWPLVNTAERLKSALNDMKSLLLTGDKGIGFFVVPKDFTLAALAAATGTAIYDLIKLNQALAAGPVVPQGTIIRRYVVG